MRRGDKKYERILRHIETLKSEEDWEGGSKNTFLAMLLSKTQHLEEMIDDELIALIADSVEEVSSYDFGTRAAFEDIAKQEWLAEILKETINHTFRAKTSVHANRSSIISQINFLIDALNENIESAERKLNHPPRLDLNLNDNEKFLSEIRRLSKALENTRRAITEKDSEDADKKIAFTTELLREFALKLSGSLGEGIGKTVTWSGRLALAWVAIGILKDLGVPVDGMIKSLHQSIIPR